MSTDKQLSDSFIWELWQTSPDDGPVAFARAVIEADRKLAQGADIPVERQEAAAQAEPHIDGWPLYSGLPPPKAEPEQSATAPSVPTLDQKMRDAGYTARPMPSRDPDHEAERPPCIGRDPLCPCQDGDACHYVATKKTKAWPVPAEKP